MNSFKLCALHDLCVVIHLQELGTIEIPYMIIYRSTVLTLTHDSKSGVLSNEIVASPVHRHLRRSMMDLVCFKLVSLRRGDDDSELINY
jgi:hypothetical protein